MWLHELSRSQPNPHWLKKDFKLPVHVGESLYGTVWSGVCFEQAGKYTNKSL